MIDDITSNLLYALSAGMEVTFHSESNSPCTCTVLFTIERLSPILYRRALGRNSSSDPGLALSRAIAAAEADEGSQIHTVCGSYSLEPAPDLDSLLGKPAAPVLNLRRI
jgi:hypothetical protein